MAELRRRAKFGRNRSNCGRDMAIFRFFKMTAAAILDFSNFKFLTVDSSRGSKCVAMSNLVEIGQLAAAIWRFFDFSRWRRRHLGFFKFQIFNGRTAQEGRNASPCQIWSKSVNWRPRYGDFSIFQDGDAAILDFSNFKFLTVGQLKRAEMRRSVKFGQNRSKRGRDMAIFRFFDFPRWRPLPSWIFKISNS